MRPPIARQPRLPRSWRRYTVGAVTLAAFAIPAAAPTPASAGILPPAGPWPTNVTGAANPLIGSPLVLNGQNATANAQLDVWLPSRGRRLHSITLSTRDTVTVRGHLRNRDNRHSIAGAVVTFVAQNGASPEWSAITSVLTNRTGVFKATFTPGLHRRFAAIYYPAVTSTSPAFSRRVLVKAKGSVWLSRPYASGRSYRFDGRASANGIAVPPSGLLVALQVRNRTGNWITARLAKTTASGRFRVRYLFPRAARLTVRMMVPSQPSWPLYAGHSNRWTISPR